MIRTEPTISREQFKALPLAATDPLASLGSRLRATLDLYRYSTEPRILLDWAVAQTQLDDPLSHFTRHELEQSFEAFAIQRQRHLSALVAAARKGGRSELLDEAARHPDPAARRALAAAMRGG